MASNYAGGGPAASTSPTTLPSGSANWAKITIPGTVVTGTTVFPPSASTFFSAACGSSTAM
jgi:hypothetical protein